MSLASAYMSWRKGVNVRITRQAPNAAGIHIQKKKHAKGDVRWSMNGGTRGFSNYKFDEREEG